MSQLTRDQLLKQAAKYGGLAIAAGSGVGALAGSAAARPLDPDFKPSGTIAIWQHQSRPYIDFFQKIADTYQQQTGVKVETLYIPYAEYYTKLNTAFSSGTGPDSVKIDGPLFEYYDSKGIFGEVAAKSFGRPTPQALQKYKFAKGTLDYFTRGGKYYGVPNDINSLMLYYNKDHFEAAGLDPTKPPKTWSQVVAYGKKLTQQSGGQITRAGFQWFWPVLPIWDYQTFIPLIEGYGGSLVSKDGKRAQLSSPAGISALSFYADIFRKYRIGSTTLTHPRFGPGLMATGLASMIVVSNYAGAVINLVSGGKLKVGDNVGVAPMPKVMAKGPAATYGYFFGWAVNAHSKNAPTAWHFLNFLLQRNHANTMWTASGILMPLQRFNTYPSTRNDPIANVMLQQLPDTTYGPKVANFNQMIQLLSDAMQSVVQGKASATDAAKNFDNQMRQVLSG